MSDPSTIHTCKSCYHVFTGNYCNLCGEKVLTKKDRSFKTVLNNAFRTVTSVDSQFVKTLWLVLINPGFLARDFANGKRVKHLNPMSLFFVLNLIYFFFPLIQLFNATLHTQLLSPLSAFYQTIIAHKIVSMNLTLETFTLFYNLKSTSLAKLMVMVFVIVSSLPLNFLYWKKNKFFTDHVGLAVELACFNLFVNAILLTVIVRVVGLGHYLNETSLTIIFIVTNLYFILRSGFTFYQERGGKLLLKSLALVVFLKIALEIYRSILFFVTIFML